MDERGLSLDLNDQDRVLIVFGYLGPLALVPLVASRKEFVKWHAKQGILVSAAAVSGFLVLKAFHLLFRRFLWAWVGEIYWVVVGLVGIGWFLLLFLCIARALEGERFKVPILGDLTDRF
jgi:uncharacterized membrane protein